MAAITEPSILMASIIDVMKDFTLIVRLITYVGGPLIVLTNPTLFSSNVSFENYKSDSYAKYIIILYLIDNYSVTIYNYLPTNFVNSPTFQENA